MNLRKGVVVAASAALLLAAGCSGTGQAPPAASAGGGFCQYNRMTYTANVSARDQVETYWPAFRAAITGANVSSVMCSCARLHQLVAVQTCGP